MTEITNFQSLGVYSILADDINKLDSVLASIRNYMHPEKTTNNFVSIISVTPFVSSFTTTNKDNVATTINNISYLVTCDISANT